MAAARAWVAGTLVAASDTAPSRPEPQAIADARLWNASEAEIAAIAEALDGPATGPVAIWPENLAVVTAWCLVGRQWRTGVVMGVNGLRTLWIGLDFLAVRSLLAAFGIRMTRELAIGLQLMERAALPALNGQGH